MSLHLEEKATTHRMMLTVQRSWIRTEFGLGALMLILASGMTAVASTAAVSGVVRDTQGVAQMGVMVEALTVGSATVATAFTDMYGRYRIANLVPGRYDVRATAALFVPATRGNLRLATGMRATVNLTLNMLSDPTVWLPAQRRKPDEPGDDWTWTLRSAANRPILRMLDDGDLVLVAAGGAEGAHRSTVLARASMMSGDAGFGEGGTHAAVTLNRGTVRGSTTLMRVDVAPQGRGGEAATEIDAGYQRQSAMAGASRVVVSFQSHPEMGSSGMQMMRMASAEKMQLGDLVDVEVGGSVVAIHSVGTALSAQPFLRVTVHPDEVWSVGYSMATARDLQGYDGLDSIAAGVPIAAMSGGRMYSETGTHQEIALNRKAGGGVIQAAVYHDAIERTAISGSGAASASDLAGGRDEVVMDTTTGSFRFLGAGYTSNGVRFTLSEPLTPSLWAELEYESGAALAARNSVAEGLVETSEGLHAESASAATVALKGRVQRTATKVRAQYRWQPQHLVTAVGPYSALSDQAFFSLGLRQAVRWGGRLPQGLEATINVTNLLAQGYTPFLSPDGRTLFLAQSPQTIQGGISFTF